MSRLLFILGLTGALTACSTPGPRTSPLAPPLAESKAQHGFVLSARFALKIESGKQAGSYAGRLDWQHSGLSHELLLSGPLGQGMAAIHLSPQGITVRQGKGPARHATDPGSLIQEALGYPLPLGDIAHWLQGQPGPDGRLTRDDTGRPKQLLENGWRISYDYDEPSSTVPTRVTVLREQEIELRLRIEDWQNTP